jgi:D-alanyl-D-alanine carboxypeptidase/D-alanyl-D-alanine-endopeptidase (penicillin-binding protein 4)
MRRYSPLFAAFLLSGLLSRAGFAGASTTAAAEPDQASGRVPLPTSVLALLDVDDAPPTLAPSWSKRIDDRLAGLTAVSRTSDSSFDLRLRTRIEAALAPLAERARVAIEVRDLDTGAVLLAHDPERALNPASNQKLITAIAAVELLGPDYRFETTVWRDGDALVLRGEGDPDLHVGDLHRLAAELASRPERLDGVRRIVIDDGAFDQELLGPGFRSDGIGESYIAPSGALALDYATVEVTVAPGSYGGPAQIHVEPSGAAIEIHDRTHTGVASLAGRAPGSGRGRGTRESLRITTRAGEHGQTIVEVEGAIAGGHAPISIRRRVADPGLVAGGCFAQLLASATGHAALPVARGQTSSTAELLARHESAPLLAVLGSALRYSNNFTAEQVLRTLAWRATGQPGSWAAGVALLERFATAVSPERVAPQRFVNGSGLSLDGRLTPSFIVDVLALSGRPSSPSQMLLASFAQAGGEGTLRNRLPHAGAHVLAKTGTYAGASTLSGVIHDDRRRLGFSILINGAPLERSRSAQDQVVAALLRAL